MTRQNYFYLFLGFALLAFAFFYYMNEQPLLGQSEAIPKEPLEVNIGWIGPLSGPVASLGVDNRNAIILALEEYTQKRKSDDPLIQLFVKDEEYKVEKAIAAYDELIKTEKPKAIFISTSSDLRALAKRALEDNILLINPIDNDENLASLNQNILLIAKETEGLGGVVANAIVDQGKKNVTVIYYRSDEFMPILAHTLREILLTDGLKIKLFDYKVGTTDFTKFLEWGKEHHSDAYVFFGYQEIGYAMRQARELGVEAPFYSINVITDPELQKNANNTSDGTYFAHFTSTDGNEIAALEFLKRYEKKYGKKPALEWTALQAYDAANILFDAIRMTKDKEGNFVENLRHTLLKTANYEGVSGDITIISTGASRGIYPSLYQLKDGKTIPINPDGGLSH